MRNKTVDRMDRKEIRQWLNTIGLWALTIAMVLFSWALIQIVGIMLNTMVVLLVFISYLLGALSVLWLLQNRIYMTSAGIRRAWQAMMPQGSEFNSESEPHLDRLTVAFFPRRPIAPENPVYRVERNVGSGGDRFLKDCQEDEDGQYILYFSEEDEAFLYTGYRDAIIAAAYCYMRGGMELDFSVVESERSLMAERSSRVV